MLADGRLADLIRRVATFGMNLMKLDLRQVCLILDSTLQQCSLICFDLNCIIVFQESGRHSETLDAITTYLDMGTYSEWDEDKRLEFLTRELKGKRPLVPLTIEVSCSFDISILEDNVVHVSPIGRDKSTSICRISSSTLTFYYRALLDILISFSFKIWLVVYLLS